jgi:hypothetical protein
MNQEIKAKWVAALRSGEYKQGHAFLNGPSGFCCLGVLCDLYGKETGVEWVDREERGPEKHMLNGYSVPPIEVREWSELGSDLGYTGVETPTTDSVSLVDLNDSGLPFSQIADIIQYAL